MMKRSVEIELISKPTTNTIIPCIQAIRANTVIGGLREAKEFIDDLRAGKKETLDLTDQQIVALQATKYFYLSYSGELNKKALRKKRTRKPRPELGEDVKAAFKAVHNAYNKRDLEELRTSCLSLAKKARQLQKEAK